MLCFAAHFGGGASGNEVMVGDSFKSSCAVGQPTLLDGVVGGASGGVAMTSFYDTTPTSSSCDVTQSNGISSSFGFTQEQVACVCEVRKYNVCSMCWLSEMRRTTGNVNVKRSLVSSVSGCGSLL